VLAAEVTYCVCPEHADKPSAAMRRAIARLPAAGAASLGWSRGSARRVRRWSSVAGRGTATRAAWRRVLRSLLPG
jgi:hypothetical protein